MNDALDGFTETVIVKRYGPPTRDHGFITMPAPSSTFDIEASVQPMTPDELESTPGLDRTSEAKFLLTETELKTVSVKDGTPADVVEWDGREWKVVAVEPMQQGILDHYEITIQRTR